MKKTLLSFIFLSLAACASAQVFPINFDVDATNTNSGSARYLRSIGIEGGETYAVSSNNTDKVYFDYTDKSFTVWYKSGTFQPIIDYAGTWMFRYVYIDWNKDGQLGDGTDPGTELVATGTCNTSSGKMNDIPPVTIPEGTQPGVYIMRYKVDWNDTNPGGNLSQPVYQNGGAIVDITLNLIEDASAIPVNVAPGTAGTTSSLPSYTCTDGTKRCSKTAVYIPSVVLNGTSMTVHTRGTILNYVYSDQRANAVAFGAQVGATTTAALNITGSTTLNKCLYIDFDRNGVFANGSSTAADDKELVAYNYYNGTDSNGDASTAASEIPSFTIPSDVEPGIYTLRWKSDDNSINPEGSANMRTNGGFCVDTRIGIRGNAKTKLVAVNSAVDENGLPVTTAPTSVKLLGPTRSVKSDGATVDVGGTEFSDGTAETNFGESFSVRVEPESDDYQLQNITIKYGYGLDGAQYASGIKQWDEIDLTSEVHENGTTLNIPADIATSDEVRISVVSKYAPVTGIDQIEAGTATTNAIYDLQVRRVKKAEKGIYIVNGKKVIY